MKSAKPILVTGSHRSGTTWVGRMIATAANVAYIHEPFNIDHDPGICEAKFDRWFTYLCDQNEGEYEEHLKKTLEFRYNLWGKLREGAGPWQLKNAIGNSLRFRKSRRSNDRPLLKDPIAVFSAEWLSSKFDTDTIVMIRHPAAFAGSLKVKKWSHPFSHFLDQPFLMEEHLSPFEDEIRYFAEEERDIVDQAALLWKLIHHVLLKFRETHPDWIFIRHEDLSIDPLAGFKSLFEKIDLEFSESVSEAVKRHSSLKDPLTSQSEDHFESIKRDSKTNIKNWNDRLTSEEIERIKSKVNEISGEFYSEEDWEIPD